PCFFPLHILHHSITPLLQYHSPLLSFPYFPAFPRISPHFPTQMFLRTQFSRELLLKIRVLKNPLLLCGSFRISVVKSAFSGYPNPTGPFRGKPNLSGPTRTNISSGT